MSLGQAQPCHISRARASALPKASEARAREILMSLNLAHLHLLSSAKAPRLVEEEGKRKGKNSKILALMDLDSGAGDLSPLPRVQERVLGFLCLSLEFWYKHRYLVLF